MGLAIHGRMLHRAVVLALLVIPACSSSASPPPPRAEPAAAAAAPVAPSKPAGCPPLTVTIDGVPAPTLTGVAVTLKNGVYETEQVELYDRGELACAAVADRGFSGPADAVAIRAYHHPEAQGLGTEAYTELGASGITLVHASRTVGEPTTLCVPATTFTPNAGLLSGKKIAIAGTLSGPWCGMRDLTPR